MAENISGFGLKIQIVASVTFPIGFTVTQFSDDADPFDVPSQQIADTGMGLNGDLTRWSMATPTAVTLNVISGSNDDSLLSFLFEANRVGKGKLGTNDVITMTGIYPDSSIITLTNGVLTNAMPGKSVSTSGKQKSKAYVFAFENEVFA